MRIMLAGVGFVDDEKDEDAKQMILDPETKIWLDIELARAIHRTLDLTLKGIDGEKN